MSTGTTMESRQVRASDHKLSPLDMICVSPPGQTFVLFSVIEGPAPDGSKTYAFAVYGTFATQTEAKAWDDELTRRGFGFQTYITPTNAPIVLPPPKDTDIECRYDDPTLSSIMDARNRRASRVDEEQATRLAELREAEIRARFHRLQDECAVVDQVTDSAEVLERRRKYRRMSNSELQEEAVRQVSELKQSVANRVLPPADTNNNGSRVQIEASRGMDFSTEVKEEKEDPNHFTFQSMLKGPLPQSKEETEEFLRKFKESGGKIQCKLGEPVILDKPLEKK